MTGPLFSQGRLFPEVQAGLVGLAQGGCGCGCGCGGRGLVLVLVLHYPLVAERGVGSIERSLISSFSTLHSRQQVTHRRTSRSLCAGPLPSPMSIFHWVTVALSCQNVTCVARGHRGSRLPAGACPDHGSSGQPGRCEGDPELDT